MQMDGRRDGSKIILFHPDFTEKWRDDFVSLWNE